MSIEIAPEERRRRLVAARERRLARVEREVREEEARMAEFGRRRASGERRFNRYDAVDLCVILAFVYLWGSMFAEAFL